MHRILLIDDNPDDRELARRNLTRELAAVQIDEVRDAAGFGAAVGAGGFDLAVTDYQLRWSNGLTVLERLKTSFPELPVIMFTASGSEEVAAAALRHGLDDYVIKSSRIDRLGEAARRALERARERRSLAEAKEAAEAANRAKDRFLAALSHELRTPLTPALALLSQLVVDPRLPDDVRQALAIVERNVEHEARLIDELLDLTRVGRGEPAAARGPAGGGDPPAAAVEEPPAGAGPVAERSLAVLLVEDHPDTAEAMSTLLTLAGHRVTLVGSVAEALAAARAGGFDVLLSDLGLPDGSGRDVMRALAPRGVPGIALSGYGMEEDLAKSREAGFARHLVKPVTFPALKAALEEVVGRDDSG